MQLEALLCAQFRSARHNRTAESRAETQINAMTRQALKGADSNKCVNGLHVYNGVGSLTRNRGRLLEKGAGKRFRALPFRVKKRGDDSQFLKQNEIH
jgi:hypothetical protein